MHLQPHLQMHLQPHLQMHLQMLLQMQAHLQMHHGLVCRCICSSSCRCICSSSPTCTCRCLCSWAHGCISRCIGRCIASLVCRHIFPSATGAFVDAFAAPLAGAFADVLANASSVLPDVFAPLAALAAWVADRRAHLHVHCQPRLEAHVQFSPGTGAEPQPEASPTCDL